MPDARLNIIINTRRAPSTTSPDALLLTETGQLTDVELPDDPDRNLTTLCRVLGCSAVDAVELSATLGMWVDDHAPERRPVNRIATTIAATYGYRRQNYYGPVLFTGGVDEDGDTMPLMPAVAEAIRDAVREGAALLGG